MVRILFNLVRHHVCFLVAYVHRVRYFLLRAVYAAKNCPAGTINEQRSEEIKDSSLLSPIFFSAVLD